jgi:hypothetical protein
VAGWRVVRMIEAASKSMSMKGEAVLLNPTGTLASQEKAVSSGDVKIGGAAA